MSLTSLPPYIQTTSILTSHLHNKTTTSLWFKISSSCLKPQHFISLLPVVLRSHRNCVISSWDVWPNKNSDLPWATLLEYLRWSLSAGTSFGRQMLDWHSLCEHSAILIIEELIANIYLSRHWYENAMEINMNRMIQIDSYWWCNIIQQ